MIHNPQSLLTASSFWLSLWCVCVHCVAGLLEKPIVLKEGQKREKKKVQRLEFTPPSEKKEKRLSIEEGSGVKLGDIPNIEFHLQRTHTGDLKPLHRLLFDRVASVSRFLSLNWQSYCSHRVAYCYCSCCQIVYSVINFQGLPCEY